MNVERVQMSQEQQARAPSWRTDQSRKCPLCPVCKRGWCDLNTDNYLECPECHVQFKNVTGADPKMNALDALKHETGSMFQELATYTNDDASPYDGTVYESCGYRLIPRLDVVEVIPCPDMPSFTELKCRAPGDPRRQQALLGQGKFR